VNKINAALKGSSIVFALSLLLFAGQSAAEEIRGKLFQVNAKPGFILVRHGKEPNDMITRLNIGDQVRIVDRNGRHIKERLHSELFKPDVGLVVTREKKGDELATTSVKVMAAQK